MMMMAKTEGYDDDDDDADGILLDQRENIFLCG